MRPDDLQSRRRNGQAVPRVHANPALGAAKSERVEQLQAQIDGLLQKLKFVTNRADELRYLLKLKELMHRLDRLVSDD
jgi:hypothetical protein